MDTKDSFDDLLAKQLQNTSNYIDDQGFTLGVMNAVAPKLSPWRVRLLLWLPVTVVTLVIACFFPWRDSVQFIYGAYLTLTLPSLVALGCGLMTSGLAIAIFKSKNLW